MMSLVKQFGLAMLLVVAVSLCTATPTQAAPSGSWGTIELINTGAEPQASGTAGVTNVKGIYTPDGPAYVGKLTVRCRRLTPGVVYSVCGKTFTANGKGNGSVSTEVWIPVVYDPSGWWMAAVDVAVDRVNPDGSYTTVLYGTVYRQ